MAISYKKLWKMLIDKNINKTDLRKLTKLSQSTIAKMSKGQNVNTEVLDRICLAMDCDISDIAEIVRGDKHE